MNRRNFSKGLLGGAIALPWLETYASGLPYKNNTRLAWFYLPNGVVPDHFNPKETGSNYTLPSAIKALKPVKDKVNIHSGCSLPLAQGHHFQTSSFLTDGTRSNESTRPELISKFGKSKIKSCDQIVAEQLGQNSYIDSMHYTTTSITGEQPKGDGGNFAEHLNHISWKSETDFVIPDRDPYIAFKRLFGNTQSAKSQPHELKSVLDFALEDIKKLNQNIAREDKPRLDQYYTAIRSIEKRLEKSQNDSYAKSLPSGTKTPDKNFAGNLTKTWRTTNNFDELVKLLSDILILAFQTNRTRVQTFMFAGEATRQKFDFLKGVTFNHHGASHFRQSPKHEECFITIINYQVELFTRICLKMNEIQEGEKTLLDNSLMMLSSAIGDGNAHSKHNLPCVVAGSGSGSVKTGFHYKHPDKMPLSNIHLGMLKTAGVKINNFGGSTNAVI